MPIRIRLKCRQDAQGKIIHVWNCTCTENFWDTAEGKNHPDYAKYLEYLAKRETKEIIV